jgi:predicted Holliday junction resolvase-like endonuclease
MTQILTIIIVAVAFLVVGYFWGRGKAEERFVEKNKRTLEGSRAGIKGRVSESVASLIPDFPEYLNTSEARFIGGPIDYIFFKGMDEKKIDEVIFLEVKSGKHPRLNDTENSLRIVIEEAKEKGARVSWREYRVPEANIPQPEGVVAPSSEVVVER